MVKQHIPLPALKKLQIVILLSLVIVFNLIYSVVCQSSTTTTTTTSPNDAILLPTIRNQASIMSLMIPKFIHIQPSSLNQHAYPYKLYLYRENEETNNSNRQVRLEGFPLLFIPQAQHGSYQDVKSLGSTLYELNGHADYRKQTYTAASYINQMTNDMTSSNRFGYNESATEKKQQENHGGDENGDEQEGGGLLGFDLFTIDFHDGEWSNFHHGLQNRQEEYLEKIVEFILQGLYKGHHKKLMIVSYNSEHSFERISQSVYMAISIQAENGKILWNMPSTKKKQQKETKFSEMINILGTSTIPHIFSNIDKSGMKWSKQLQQVLASILLSIANSGANSEHGLLDMSEEDRDLIISQYLSLKSNSMPNSLLWDDHAARREGVKKNTLDNKSIVELSLGKIESVKFEGDNKVLYYMLDTDTLNEQEELNTIYLFTNFLRHEIDVFLSEDHKVGGDGNGPQVVAKSIYKLYKQQITLLPYMESREDHLEIYNSNQKIAKVMIKIPNLKESLTKRKIYVRLTRLYSTEELSREMEESYPDRFIVASPHPGAWKETAKKHVKPHIVENSSEMSLDFWKNGISVKSKSPYIVVTSLPLTYSYKLSIFNTQCESNLYPIVQFHYGGMFEFESQYVPLRHCGENILNLQFLNLTDISDKGDEKLRGIAIYLLNTNENQTEFELNIRVDFEETFLHTIFTQHLHTLVCDVFVIVVILLSFEHLQLSPLLSAILMLLLCPFIALLQYHTMMGQVLYLTDLSLVNLLICLIYSWIGVVLVILTLRIFNVILFGFISKFIPASLVTVACIALFATSFALDPSLPFIALSIVLMVKQGSYSSKCVLSSVLYLLISLVIMGPSTFSYIKEWNYWISLKTTNQTIFAVLPPSVLTRVCSPLLLAPFYVNATNIIGKFKLANKLGKLIGLLLLVSGIVLAVVAKIETFYVLPVLSVVILLNTVKGY